MAKRKYTVSNVIAFIAFLVLILFLATLAILHSIDEKALDQLLKHR